MFVKEVLSTNPFLFSGLRPKSNRIEVKEGETAILEFLSNMPKEYSPKDTMLYRLGDKIMFDGNKGNTSKYTLQSYSKRRAFEYRQHSPIYETIHHTSKCICLFICFFTHFYKHRVNFCVPHYLIMLM